MSSFQRRRSLELTERLLPSVHARQHIMEDTDAMWDCSQLVNEAALAFLSRITTSVTVAVMSSIKPACCGKFRVITRMPRMEGVRGYHRATNL